MEILKHNKNTCLIILAVLILILGYFMYSNSTTCGCDERYGNTYVSTKQIERLGPQYKNPPERFTGERRYEQGPYIERFSDDFTRGNPEYPELQTHASLTSPFIGSL